MSLRWGKCCSVKNDRLGRLFDRLELDGSETEVLFCFLLALHDLGKFSKPFQAKAPQFYPTFLGELPSLPDPGTQPRVPSAMGECAERCARDHRERRLCDPCLQRLTQVQGQQTAKGNVA